MAKVSLKALATISRETWSPSKSTHSYVWHYSIPNFDTGLAKLESISSIMSNKFLISEPCVLISKLNPKTPRVWLIEKLQGEISVCSTEFIVLTPKSQDDLRFLYFLLKSNEVKQRLSEIATGTSNSHQRVRPEDILSLEVECVESIFERQKCSNILMSLESHISLDIEMSKTLEEIAQTIFKSWFIDFDPVKAKMAGEKPVGMDDVTAALFPDSMEDSELGPIPKGWSVQEFGEVNHLLMGQSPPGDTYNSIGEGVPFYQGRTDFGMRFPKQRVFCTAGTRFANAGEVLISVRAPVGDLNQAIEDCVIGRGVASAMHKSGSQAYSYALLCSLKPKLAYYNGEGTVFGAINRSDFNSLKIVEPPRQIVALFETVAGPFNDEIRNLFIQTESLIELRDSLLPRLISGEIQIPEEMLAT